MPRPRSGKRLPHPIAPGSTRDLSAIRAGRLPASRRPGRRSSATPDLTLTRCIPTMSKASTRTTPPPTRRKAAPPLPSSNVVPLRAPTKTTADIVRDVQARREQGQDRITALLDDLNAMMDRRREQAVQQRVLPIGRGLDGKDFADWVEIGEAMLAKRRLA